VRIRNELVQRITVRIVNDLVEGGLVTTERPEEVAAALVRVIEENARAEEALDAEVHEIMHTHEDEIRQGNIQYHEMFRMIKQKLAKEKKFPI
jgi:hypothetical protein